MVSKLRVEQLETLDGLHTKNVSDLLDDINEALVTTSTGEQPLAEAIDQRGLVFDNVADLQAATNLSEGVKVRTLGYYSPGDGGGNDYEIVAAGTGTDDGGSFIDLAGSGSQAQGLFSDQISVKKFGATGQGVTDDTLFVQNAVNYAGEVASIEGGCTVLFPVGRYRIDSGTAQPLSEWRLSVIVPDNVTIEGYGATIYTEEAIYSTRTVVFQVRGSNVTLKGLTFVNSETSTWSVSIGMGDRYDDGMEEGRTYTNLLVEDCKFHLAWLSVSAQLWDESATPDTKIAGVRIKNCNSYGRQSGTGANFNVRSVPYHRISNVVYDNLRTWYGETASALNLLGVLGFQINNCRTYGNGYAGLEIENSSENGVVSNYTSKNDRYSIWVDDSSKITFSNVTVETPTSGRGVYVTHQGISGQPEYVTGRLVFSNITFIDAGIRLGPFGDGGGTIDKVTFNNFQMLQDTVESSIFCSSTVSDMAFSNGLISGSRTNAFTGTVSTSARVSNVVASKVRETDDASWSSTGSGRVYFYGCDFENYSVSAANQIRTGCTSGGDVVEDVIRGQRVHYISGTPEGVLPGGPGSLALSSTVGAIYVKASGTGNTGWSRLATT